MTQYETTIVFDSFLKDEDMQNLTTKIQNFIKNNGGQIQEIEEWGKKRLAYEINRKQYGNYYHILFTGQSSLPELLEREFRLEESILRYLTIKSDPKALLMKEKEATEKKERESRLEAESVEMAAGSEVVTDAEKQNQDEGENAGTVEETESKEDSP
ncbi:MAG: 30S ribosomal protein S6 [bacterium]